MSAATLEASRVKELEGVLTNLSKHIDRALDGEIEDGTYDSENFRVTYWNERGKVMLEVIEK